MPPTVGEVDVNVTEVGLEALSGEMSQGDEVAVWANVAGSLTVLQDLERCADCKQGAACVLFLFRRFHLADLYVQTLTGDPGSKEDNPVIFTPQRRPHDASYEP